MKPLHPAAPEFDEQAWGYAVVPALVYATVLLAACAAALW